MLRLLALTVLLCIHPALASAQDAPSLDAASLAAPATSSEQATPYDVASGLRRPPSGWPRPELDGWRRDAEYGLRLRLDVESNAVAAENARRGREEGAVGTQGETVIVLGALCLAGGLVTELVALGLATGDAIGGSGGSRAGLAIGGGVLGGVGILGLLIGGILLSQRPRHLEPGAVTLTLGPGSLGIAF